MPPRFPTLEVSDPALTTDGLHFLTVHSPALRHRADLTVWLPGGEKPAAPLPAVILLHGVYGSHWAWAFKGAAHLTAARLIASGEIPPLALLMPSDGLWGNGSGYLKHPDDCDFESWIVDEVPAAAAQAFPAHLGPDSPLCLAGLSMGGFGTLRLGARHGEKFRALSAHSSCTSIDALQPFIQQPSAGLGQPGDALLIDALLAHRATLPPFRFDCGLADTFLADNRALHSALTAAGLPHAYEEFPGGHTWDYWITHLADSLRFFARFL